MLRVDVEARLPHSNACLQCILDAGLILVGGAVLCGDVSGEGSRVAQRLPHHVAQYLVLAAAGHDLAHHRCGDLAGTLTHPCVSALCGHVHAVASSSSPSRSVAAAWMLCICRSLAPRDCAFCTNLLMVSASPALRIASTALSMFSGLGWAGAWRCCPRPPTALLPSSSS